MLCVCVGVFFFFVFFSPFLTFSKNQDFATFKTNLINALELNKRPHFSGELRFKYEDEEGDEVTICTDADLLEALRQVNNSDDSLLRLSIVAFKAREDEEGQSPHAHHHHGRGHHGHGHGRAGQCTRGMGGAHPLMAMLDQLKSSVPDLLKNPALRSMAEGVINSHSGLVRIDTGRICDSCNRGIMGDRYVSTTHPDFDLCSECMLNANGAALEPLHKFRKVSAFDALMECIQNGGGVEAFFAGGAGEPEKEKEQGPLKHNAFCDICQDTIVGSRFKSFVEADYDECSKCRLISKRPASEFFEITDVNVRSIPAEAVSQYKAKVEAENAEKKAKEAQTLADKVFFFLFCFFLKNAECFVLKRPRPRRRLLLVLSSRKPCR
jgi:hypothetical protein